VTYLNNRQDFAILLGKNQLVCLISRDLFVSGIFLDIALVLILLSNASAAKIPSKYVASIFRYYFIIMEASSMSITIFHSANRTFPVLSIVDFILVIIWFRYLFTIITCGDFWEDSFFFFWIFSFYINRIPLTQLFLFIIYYLLTEAWFFSFYTILIRYHSFSSRISCSA